jgi:transposase
MALGRRKQSRQTDLFVTVDSLPTSDGHVFYTKLNQFLSEEGFDRWLEDLCAPYYSLGRGRPGIPPGVYFRMLLVGYFEGIQTQRGIAWRCADSLSLRQFLGFTLTESTPDHSSMTHIRERLPSSIHEKVFEWVLGVAVSKKLIRGKTVAIDSTTLEADAAMKSIVRRDTGEDWREYVTGLMRAEGVIGPDARPTDEELRRFDKKRRDKKVSNDDWQSSVDPDAEITKMKDGTTHLAYKAENVVDTESNLIVAAQIKPATAGDAATIEDSLHAAQLHLENVGLPAAIKEVTADKGYHSTETLTALAEHTDYKTYIPEPQQPKGRRRKLRKLPEIARRAILNNRKRTKGQKGRSLQRARSEKVERTFAHTLETGGGRRTRLRGLKKNQKRYWILTAAYNLGVIMRQLFKIGTARSLQGMSWAGMLAILAALWSFASLFPTPRRYRLSLNRKYRPAKYIFAGQPFMNWNPRNRHYSTGC